MKQNELYWGSKNAARSMQKDLDTMKSTASDLWDSISYQAKAHFRHDCPGVIPTMRSTIEEIQSLLDLCENELEQAQNELPPGEPHYDK